MQLSSKDNYENFSQITLQLGVTSRLIEKKKYNYSTIFLLLSLKRETITVILNRYFVQYNQFFKIFFS